MSPVIALMRKGHDLYFRKFKLMFFYLKVVVSKLNYRGTTLTFLSYSTAGVIPTRVHWVSMVFVMSSSDGLRRFDDFSIVKSASETKETA
jgi:hypothetical protein